MFYIIVTLFTTFFRTLLNDIKYYIVKLYYKPLKTLLFK